LSDTAAWIADGLSTATLAARRPGRAAGAGAGSGVGIGADGDRKSDEDCRLSYESTYALAHDDGVSGSTVGGTTVSEGGAMVSACHFGTGADRRSSEGVYELPEVDHSGVGGSRPADG
jgi:hypothetical protein